MITDLREQLTALANPQYKKFASSLLQGVDPDTIIGVRLPHLRQLARLIADSDLSEYPGNVYQGSFEETMLYGMVIGYLKGSPSFILPLVAEFVPLIDNWSTCDSFCSGLKLALHYKKEVWNFLMPYIKSNDEYSVRFAVVMMLLYYIDDAHLPSVFCNLDNICCDHYYAKMAIAWAVSVCYKRFPKPTLTYLGKCCLDDFTYNKALQKILESRTVNKECKDLIRTLKRK